MKRQTIQPKDGKTLICTKCRERKPYVEFYRAKPGSMNDKTYGGFAMPCRECERTRCRGRLRTEEVKAREKAYKSTSAYKANRSEQRRAAYAAMSPEEKAKHKAYAKTMHEKHREKKLAEWRRRYKTDPAYRQKILDGIKRYRESPQGRETRNRLNRAWFKTPKGRQERVNSSARRRARMKATLCTLTATEWQAILEIYKFRCAYCGKKTKKLEQEHIFPVSRGGAHTIENVVPSCNPCNRKKGTKLLKPKCDIWLT